jgi:ubiquinol-cytochrome c reductase cytochrome b subunit
MDLDAGEDGLNAAGVGAFFNVTNFGQMYSYHVFLLPLAVVAIVIAHVLLVRRHGIVPPFQLSDGGALPASARKADPEPVPKREPSVGNEGAPDAVPGEAAP